MYIIINMRLVSVNHDKNTQLRTANTVVRLGHAYSLSLLDVRRTQIAQAFESILSDAF